MKEIKDLMKNKDPEQAREFVEGHTFSKKDLKNLKRYKKLLPKAVRKEVERIIAERKANNNARSDVKQ